MEKILREKLGNGIDFTCISTDKFKTSCLSINFVLPIKDISCALFAALPKVLRQGTADYPDIEKIGVKLDSLFGARIEPFARKRGETLSVGFVSDVIDERYALGGEGLLKDTIGILGKLVFDPYLEESHFSKSYVEGEKENLKDEIAAQINDKRTYAVTRLYEIMCKTEPFGKNAIGTIDQANQIDTDLLQKAYFDMLKKAHIKLFYCGSENSEKVKNIFMSVLAEQDREELFEVETKVIKDVHKVKTVTEEMDVSQGKLSLGFRTGVTANDGDYSALMLFNTAYGASTSSKLFLNVREKKSLCYYAASSNEKLKGVMAVTSGIEEKNFDIAREEILFQLDSIKKGQISDDEVLSAKKTITGSLTSLKDSPLSLEGFYLTQAICENNADVDDIIADVSKVTRDEIIAVSNKIKLDTVYFLKGGNK